MAGISKYTVANGLNVFLLAEYVNSLLAKGWEPYGSPFITGNNGVNQAMIKRER